MLAAGAFSLAGLLPEEAFLAWGWRACFLVSIVLLGIGAYIRLSVMETPEFAKVQERKEISRLPLRDLLAEPDQWNDLQCDLRPPSTSDPVTCGTIATSVGTSDGVAAGTDSEYHSVASTS